jgi:hypothetical protein
LDYVSTPWAKIIGQFQGFSSTVHVNAGDFNWPSVWQNHLALGRIHRVDGRLRD